MAEELITQSTGAEKTISRAPTAAEIAWDRTFRVLTYVFAWFMLVLVLAIVAQISVGAVPSIRDNGVKFLTGMDWVTQEGRERYGVFPAIWGTLYSSLLALLIGSVFGIAVAIFLSERLLSQAVFRLLKLFGVHFHPFWGTLPDRLEDLLKNLVELLAAIPSVVYGLWGIFVVIPLLQPLFNALGRGLSWLPIFGRDADGTPYELNGPALLPASIVLAIMILPTVSAISRDALTAVPPKLREAAYGLGATRWETVLGVILPTSLGGIFGSIILAFGRALGETMALAMLAGGGSNVSWSLFKPVKTLASLLANEFKDTSGLREVASLMYAALVLLAITLLVNMLGALVVERTAGRMKGGR